MYSSIFLTILLFVFIFPVQGFKRNEGCRFEVDVDSFYSPILWTQNGKIYPSYNTLDDKWYLEIDSGVKFNAGCTGAKNFWNLECVTGSIVKEFNKLLPFESLTCKTKVTETVRRNGTCYNGYTNIDIGFETGNQLLTLMTICHNEAKDETLYVKSEIDGPNLHLSESINRPSFKEGEFFTEIDANGCYTPVGQIATVAELVGSTSLANDYIKQNVNLFMSRGHLTPNGDPIYAHEKRATFYYVNAHPQWQTINGGNWNLLENAVREYAKSKQAVLTVYTGTFGVTTLDDINGNPVEIWLGKSSIGELVNRLPCPHQTWKVIHDKAAGIGVAVIQINNPYAIVKPEDMICEDICHELSWVTWRVTDIRLGYTYCCSVQSFKEGLSYAPDLGSLPLLDY